MSHSQFNYYAVTVGINFAKSMALQEGVTFAQVQLWIARSKPVSNAAVVESLAF